MSRLPAPREKLTSWVGERGLRDRVRPSILVRQTMRFTDSLSRWKYSLFVSMDANFRLNRQDVSSWSTDPALGDGYAYFVPTADFLKCVADRWDDAEVSFRQCCYVHEKY